MSTASKGEGFDAETGLPTTISRRRAQSVLWFDFICDYVDMKWPDASPKHRKSIAECLVTATMGMLTTPPPPDEARAIRSALLNWGFNKVRRGADDQPSVVTNHLQWVRAQSRPIVDLSDTTVLRSVLGALSTLINGNKAAGRTAALRRTVLSNALDYAVERGVLAVNPLKGLKWTAPKSVSSAVDRKVVVNPVQARALIATVARTPRNGKRLAAFFGCMYYSALRPEEAVSLRKANLELPATDGQYGWLILDQAALENGRQWSDGDHQRDERQLKHRAVGDTRRVPCPAQLVTLLRDHLAEYGTDDKGRLFRSESGAQLSTGTYIKLWGRARASALSPEQVASPLARRPYDLRHSAVSNGPDIPSPSSSGFTPSVSTAKSSRLRRKLGIALSPTEQQT